MSEQLDRRAEIVKLARLLGTAPDALGYLEAVPAAALVAFRDQVTDLFFDGDRGALGRLAAGSRVLPGGVAAMIAQRALGPLLCARIAGLVEPAKAIDTARHLPPEFLADVAVEIDPRRAKEVIGRVPAPLVAEVAGVLTSRDETVTMGRFVGFVGDEAVRAAMSRIDDAALLRIAFTMEGKDRLDHMLSLLPQERLAGVLDAADRAALWPEALDLLSHLSAERKAELGDRAVAEEGLIEKLAQAAAEQELWDTLLPIATELRPAARDRVAALAATLPQSSLERVIEVVNAQDLWSAFVPLAADHMDAAGRERVAEIVAGVHEDVIQGLADAVERDGLWSPLLTIADAMEPEQLSRIADRLLAVGVEERLPALLAAVEQSGLWETGLTLLADLGAELQSRIAPVAAGLSEEDRVQVVDHATQLGLLDRLGPVGAALTGA